MTKGRAIAASNRVRICDGVTAREFDGEWIVLDLNGGNYFGLNELGGIIWQHICAGRSLGDIAALVAPDYQVSSEVVLQDVLKLVDELVERGLAQVNG